jgi:hypothetical protein
MDAIERMHLLVEEPAVDTTTQPHNERCSSRAI